MNKPGFALNPNYTESIRFLQSFHPSCYWILTSIQPRQPGFPNGIVTATFDVSKQEQVTNWLEKFGAKKWNLYFTVNPPGDGWDKKPAKKDIHTVYYFHVDCDPQEGKDVKEEQDRYVKVLKAFKHEPTFIVNSGSGIHGYWRLYEPTKKIDIAEQINKVLEKQLTNETQTFNIDRIMRLPGTINYPDAGKIAKGRVPTLSTVISESGHVCNLSNFNIIVPPKPPTAKQVDKSRSEYDFAQFGLMLKQGKTDEEIQTYFLDPVSEHGERIRERPDPETYFAEELRRAKTKFGKEATIARRLEQNKDWPGGTGQWGFPEPTTENFKYALTQLKVRVYYDMFAGCSHLVDVPGFPGDKPVSDLARNRLKIRFQEEFGMKFGETEFSQRLDDVAWDSKINPVLEYFDSLKWDGIPRLDRWLITYAYAEDTEYVRAIGKLHLIAGVRRVRKPGCQKDEMLVLISPKQGLNKSTAIGILAKKPSWLVEDLSLNTDAKVLVDLLKGKWIVECQELKGLSKAEANAVKGLLSRPKDRARESYGRYADDFERKCLFFASSNDRRFLSDPTGNRRFWPVHVGEIDLEGLRKNVDQLWAEAVHYEAQGISHKLPRELWDAAAVEQEKATQNTSIYDGIERLLSGHTGIVDPNELWIALGFEDIRSRGLTQQHQFGQSMDKLGWERKYLPINGQRIWSYVKSTSRVILTFSMDQRGRWKTEITKIPIPKIPER